jgi:hypothetical protein
MSIFKKLLILITFIIFLVIFWPLVIARSQLKKETEGFSLNPFASTESKELSNSENNSKITIISSSEKLQDLSLCELCLKGSYNSALIGNEATGNYYISTDMLQYVINRGCRYLDFEVLYIPVDDAHPDGAKKPVVGFTTDPHFYNITSSNTILLNTILTSAVSNAFTSTCPNFQDPLFINLRIKSNNDDVYSSVASAIDSTIKNKIYVDGNRQIYTNSANNELINPAKRVTKNTTVSQIKGCVIISVDKTINPNYIYASGCDPSGGACYDLVNYTNINTGSQDMNLILYSLATKTPPLQILDDNIHTTVKTITVANPDNLYLMNSANKNPKHRDYLLNYGCHWVPHQFNKNDAALAEYEKFFNDHNSAFVPLSSAISYYMYRTQ